MKLVRLPVAVVVAAALLGFAPAPAAVPVLVVEGRGFGHGVGMAQDGARAMGRAGATTAEILGHFYPGVGTGRATGEVRVVVRDTDEREVVLTFPGGGEVRSPRHGPQEPGFPVAVEPGGAVRIRHDGQYRVTPSGPVRAQSAGARQVLPLPPSPGAPSTTSTSLDPAPAEPPPTTAAPTTSTTSTTPTTSPERTSRGRVWAVPAAGATVGLPARAARYRGSVEAAAGGRGLRLVNQLDVEQYLRGMGEVRDPSWPSAGLRAQAITARTYALRAMAAAGEICDSQRCQVYLGQQAEYAAMDRAVQETAGQVLRYRSGFAAAVYSANGGGVSATPREGFGTPDEAHPYLRAASYVTDQPDTWEVRIALTDLAGRAGYPGDLTAVTVTETGASGRPLTVGLDGSAGRRTVAALDLQRALGLRSTRWQTRIEAADAPPPPPEPAEHLQAFPDQLTRAASPRAVTKATLTRPGPEPPAGGRSPIVPAALTIVGLAMAAAATRRRRTR